ncbi:MAG: hypothetical protein IPJ30_17000 [Acidobacteria bacterium]|nr:hypothetical protein [Acidobacteriota bacterium]
MIRFFVLFIVLSIAAGSAVSVPAQSKKDRERARKIAVQGDALFNKKDYRGAIGKYAEAIVVFPGYAAAHYWKAYAHYYLKENDQALTDFYAAIAKGYDKPIEIYRVRWFCISRRATTTPRSAMPPRRRGSNRRTPTINSHSVTFQGQETVSGSDRELQEGFSSVRTRRMLITISPNLMRTSAII